MQSCLAYLFNNKTIVNSKLSLRHIVTFSGSCDLFRPCQDIYEHINIHIYIKSADFNTFNKFLTKTS